MADFDHALEAKARTLATLVCEDNQNLEVEFAGEYMPEFETKVNPEYFQFRWWNGSVIERSSQLGERDLPLTRTHLDAPCSPISGCRRPSRPIRADFHHATNRKRSGNGIGGWGGGIAVDSREVERLVVANNIVSENLSFQVVVGAGVPAAQVAVHHNLIDGFRDYEDEIRGASCVEGDPRFVNRAAADLRLLAGSPAVNAGDSAALPSGATTDHDGSTRVVGGKVDIGAFELPAVEPRAVSREPRAVKSRTVFPVSRTPFSTGAAGAPCTPAAARGSTQVVELHGRHAVPLAGQLRPQQLHGVHSRGADLHLLG